MGPRKLLSCVVGIFQVMFGINGQISGVVLVGIIDIV